MKKCLECGFTFEEAKECQEDLTPGGSFEGGSFIRKFKGCPICEGAYEEIKEEEENE